MATLTHTSVLRAAAPPGTPARFVDLKLKREPFVLVLLRHLACNCAPLGILDIIAAVPATTTIIAVTTSTDADAAWSLIDEIGVARRPHFEFLIDPTASLYTILGLHEGVLATLTWRRWRNIIGALAFPFQLCCKGRIPYVNAGQPFQQGGVFAFDATGRCMFEHRETSPAWPPLDADRLRAVLATSHGEPSSCAAPVESSTSEPVMTKGHRNARRRAPSTSDLKGTKSRSSSMRHAIRKVGPLQLNASRDK